eukprot:CAMPEP_0113685416 /NCGR_PEP_ID=MMETSP0038_2-20120614/14657_1 /TAXON_ID=2898 /ORGANISM="Cryptomonas paramecium" /LENGTH=198 /DNA_ID=CAMNT_0000605495 /DNA_START=516 /DNA_END=1109 /DNA_ORIENTATION=- /assembly_acc=CAM_ASM_000170
MESNSLNLQQAAEKFEKCAVSFADNISSICDIIQSLQDAVPSGLDNDNASRNDSFQFILTGGDIEPDRENHDLSSSAKKFGRPGSEILWPNKLLEPSDCTEMTTRVAKIGKDDKADDKGIGMETDDVCLDDEIIQEFITESHLLDEARRSPILSLMLNPRPPNIPVCGLANQGATCYLNSLLQILYAIPEFRSFIYSW